MWCQQDTLFPSISLVPGDGKKKNAWNEVEKLLFNVRKGFIKL